MANQRYRLIAWLLALLQLSAGPLGWAKNQKTSGPMKKPIGNYYLDTTSDKVISEDGKGGQAPATSDEVYSTREFTAAEKKAIADAFIAMFGANAGFKKLKDATVTYNCHGLTFKNRAFALGRVTDDIETVLKDQGWKEKMEKDAKVGDIVIYRKDGQITHSGVILAVAGGKVTSVQSKWGQGPEFEHPPTVVPTSYGTYEVWAGGMPLPSPPPEPLQIPQEGLEEPWPADAIVYSIAPVDTVSTSNPSTVYVGETFQVQIHVTGSGVGSFMVPILFNSYGGLLVFPVYHLPPAGHLVASDHRHAWVHDDHRGCPGTGSG